MTQIGTDGFNGHWINDPVHRAFLENDAHAQLAFYRKALRADGAFDVLAIDGTPIAGSAQQLHNTTRMVHSYALASLWGAKGHDDMIDAGMAFLWNQHRDTTHGGYVYGLKDGAIVDDKKLAYGHVFVLLAGSSAKNIGHPDADRLIADAAEVLDTRFWDDGAGLFFDEFNRDWSPFSTYRGYNANMHGVEALLAAYEATDETLFLTRAGRILSFFMETIAPSHDWRLPEHYTPNWTPDLTYQGDPMFRPRGTTPGHSFELGRLYLQYWDLAGRKDDGSVDRARSLIETALNDAWVDGGGFVYTLDYSGAPQVTDRYWWPLTEAIGAMVSLIKLDGRDSDEAWYRRLWQAASDLFIDYENGGWFHEVDASGKPAEKQFIGKPDHYHAIQADLFPLDQRLTRLFT